MVRVRIDLGDLEKWPSHRIPGFVDALVEGYLDSAAHRDAPLVLASLRRSSADLVVVNVEDLWLETRAQNMPGTVSEHPNWQRRTRPSLEEIADEVAEAYLAYWDAYAEAVLNLDASLVEGFAAGEELEERLYLPGQKNPIPLRTHAAFQLLAQLRDEAHRFSNKKRTDEGRRVRVSSALLGVHGIGQKTERRLLAALGSVDAIRAATEEELVSAGATRRQALAIRAAFGSAAASEEEAIENAFRA